MNFSLTSVQLSALESSLYGSILIIHLLCTYIISNLYLKLREVCDFVQNIDAFHLVDC